MDLGALRTSPTVLTGKRQGGSADAGRVRRTGRAPIARHGIACMLRQPRVVRWTGSDQGFGGSARREGHPVARVTLETAVELELHEGALDLGGARLALPD